MGSKISSSSSSHTKSQNLAFADAAPTRVAGKSRLGSSCFFEVGNHYQMPTNATREPRGSCNVCPNDAQISKRDCPNSRGGPINIITEIFCPPRNQQGPKWQYFTLPTARLSHHFGGSLLRCRSQRMIEKPLFKHRTNVSRS